MGPGQLEFTLNLPKISLKLPKIALNRPKLPEVAQSYGDLGADYMSRAGLVEGLALSAEMNAQPGIT